LVVACRKCRWLFIFFLLNVKWGRQVSLLSRVIPRYLTTVEFGISDPWKYEGGHSVFLSVKFTWTDFSGFILIRHLVAQFSIKFRWFCKEVEDYAGQWPGESIAVSSAYEAMVVFVEFGISAVYMLNKSGDKYVFIFYIIYFLYIATWVHQILIKLFLIGYPIFC